MYFNVKKMWMTNLASNGGGTKFLHSFLLTPCHKQLSKSEHSLWLLLWDVRIYLLSYSNNVCKMSHKRMGFGDGMERRLGDEIKAK